MLSSDTKVREKTEVSTSKFTIKFITYSIYNLVTFNFERLPRFYKIMLLFQLFRARFAMDYLKLLLKNMDLRIEIQGVI